MPILEILRVHYLAVYYRRADVSLTTPYHDGMNLTVKEFIASQVENKGALILSEFAGAARDKVIGNNSILVNPFDKNQIANAIYKAVNMSKSEKRKRMTKMRRQVKNNDVHKWFRTIMSDAISLYNKRS